MAERSDGGTACGAHTRRAIAHAAGVVAGSWTAANEPKAGGTGNSALIGGRVGQQNAGHVAVRPQRVIQPTCRYRRREMAMSSGINRANLPKTLSWTRMCEYNRLFLAECLHPRKVYCHIAKSNGGFFICPCGSSVSLFQDLSQRPPVDLIQRALSQKPANRNLLA